MKRTVDLVIAALLLAAGAVPSPAATGAETQARITRDVASGLPVVAHVVVALCDNTNQGIVPVPAHLGNGQDARSNLYWGAMFGVRTYFARQGAFVGHNGLMDFSLSGPQKRRDNAPAASSMVLACLSKEYFLYPLHAAGSHPLLLTTGLMAPEAYTLEAAIRSWAGGAATAATREAAAAAYHRYQKCGLNAARNLFWGESP